MFTTKIIIILILIVILFKIISIIAQWRDHKILMLPKLIFLIICIIIGVKGFSTVRNIQHNASHKQTVLIKKKNNLKHLSTKKGDKAILKKSASEAESKGSYLLSSAKGKFDQYKFEHQ